MSLATRCPACGTTFRVVQDQLKISGGWVRCGQCHQVFNGLEALLELPDLPAAPAPLAPTNAATEPPALAEPRAAAAPANTPDATDATDDPVDTVQLALDAPTSAEPDSPIPTGEVAGELSRWPDSQHRSLFGLVTQPEGVDLTRLQPDPDDSEPLPDFDPVVSVPPFAASRWRAAAAESHPETVAQEAAPEPPAVPSPPSRRARRRKPAFMRQAERAAQWRRPAMRAVLGSASLALSLMLAAQAGHQYRDDLAARWPMLQAPLQRWCELARCQVLPPRHLASLTLDSSGLQRTTRPQVLRFEADLRNSASHAVRAPALEVNFQDLQGQTIARKVLLPEALNAPASGIAPDGVWHVSALLDVGTLQITGFAAEVFYP